MSTSDWGSVDLGGTIGTLQAGGNIRLAHWPGAPDGPGTVILVQGYSEFMEVYGETIGEFRRRGYAVVSFDFRGQGGSSRKVIGAAHLSSFRDHASDVCAAVRFAAETGMPRPFFIAAHSMGGLAALHAAPIIAKDVARMVLVTPLIQVARLPVPEPLARAGAIAASLFGLSRMRVVRSLKGPRDAMNNHLTTDPDRFQAYCALADANPALASGPPTFGWVRAVLAAAAATRRTAEKPLPIPTLMLAAGRDTVVSTPAIDRFARAAPGGGLVILPEARHQLFLERDGLRNAVFAAFDAFVEPAAADAEAAGTAPVRAKRKFRPQRFVETRTGTPVTVEAPRVAPEPPKVADVLAAAERDPETPPVTAEDFRKSEAAEERRTVVLEAGEDDALLLARRRTRVAAVANVDATPDKLATPEPEGEPQSTAVYWSSDDSVDALMRTSRRRQPSRQHARRRHTALRDDKNSDQPGVDWTSEPGAAANDGNTVGGEAAGGSLQRKQG